MDVVFCPVTPVPDCLPLPSLHGGPSRLSPAAGAMPPPPLLAKNAQAAMPSEEELFFSDHDPQPSPLRFSEDDGFQLGEPPFSVDDLRASFPDEDIELAPLLCEEDFQQVMFDTEQQPGAPRPDGGGQGGTKRKLLPPPPPPLSEQDDDDEDRWEEPAHRRRAKKRAGKKRQQFLLVLRAWHREIAARVLRSPELDSRGRTALRCQCAELAPAGRLCALHQDAPDRAWIHETHGGVPPIGDPREVVVPSLAAGDGMVAVMQYARWRRGVFLPTRFYVEAVEHAAARRTEMVVD